MDIIKTTDQENNQEQNNYVYLLRQILEKLYKFIQNILPENKKDELPKLHELSEWKLLFLTNLIKEENVNKEIENYISKFEIDPKYKDDIMKFFFCIIDVRKKYQKE